jgi:predicted unusual protein kinase regulating ubiquinone biosynthesis (AarF/ABC1/UbiB family)
MFGTFVKILAKAKPHVKETMEAEVFEQSLLMLQTKAGNPKAKPMYHEAVIKYALSLLGQVNKKTYESLAQILALPLHRHARKLKKKLVDAEGVALDGPRRRMNRQMREVAIKNKWMKKYGFLDIILVFNSMVMRGSMILSTAASTRNRLIGVDLSQGHSAIESEFNGKAFLLGNLCVIL